MVPFRAGKRSNGLVPFFSTVGVGLHACIKVDEDQGLKRHQSTLDGLSPQDFMHITWWVRCCLLLGVLNLTMLGLWHVLHHTRNTSSSGHEHTP